MEAGSVILMVASARNPDGTRACSGRGQFFDGGVDGREVVIRSTQPLLDAARVLLAEGLDPATRIVMRYAGRDYDALRSTVGAAARLSVTHATKDGKPRFVKWQPNRFREGRSVCGEPPMHRTEPGTTTAPKAAE